MNELNSENSGHHGLLPPRLKLLIVTTADRPATWLADAFATDSATRVELIEVIGIAAGLTKLRDEAYDAVLVGHAPGQLDALDFTEGLRAGGTEEPIVILGTLPPQEIDAFCFEVGADDYCCISETTVRGLLWKLARAIELKDLIRENRRLVQMQRQRLKQEHLEAQRLLEQQRILISDLENLAQGKPCEPTVGIDRLEDCRPKSVKATNSLDLPTKLVNHYRELLRTYVIMGVGNLTQEMAQLAQMLARAEVSAQQAMQLHVAVLEEIVRGLGSRSARHVMNRADLLALEVIGHLADGYRRQLLESRNPPRQQILPFAA